MEIADRIFIVTGASSGLGAATARRLVSAGARVLRVDLREPGDECGEFARVDITDPAATQALFDDVARRFGALHGLVNCAGIAPAEKVVGRDGALHRLDSFLRTLQVNLVGSFDMIRLAADLMSKGEASSDGERGVIVNTASIAAFDGQMGQAAYAASKGGVVAMTLPLARELSRFGIRVCTIAPGIMATPMVEAMPANVQASLGAMVPFPARLGRPDEFAGLVQHIVENAYLNGEVIRLDGAVRMAAR